MQVHTIPCDPEAEAKPLTACMGLLLRQLLNSNNFSTLEAMSGQCLNCAYTPMALSTHIPFHIS